MAVVEDAKGPLWVDGRFTARVRGPGPSAARAIRARSPFARVGSHPDAEIRIDHPAADPAHALLLLDRRGVFGVDLLSGSGTRFAGLGGGSAWLGPGDVVAIAGHRVELLRLVVDGRSIDPPLDADDPLAPSPDADLVAVLLEPLEGPGPPWMLGSALAFLGRDPGCAVRVEDPSAARVHCALFRGPEGAHLIDLLAAPTLIDGEPVAGASALRDGALLGIGRTRFLIRVGPAGSLRPPGRELALRDPDPSPEALVARLIDAAGHDPGPAQAEILGLLRGQLDRIEALGREIADLRDEVRGLRGPSLPPATPLRLELLRPDPGPPASDPAAWLLERLRGLESRHQSSRSDLLGRVAAIVPPTNPPTVLPARLEPPKPATS